MPPIKKILSIDGGGIRGIIPGQILVEIEKAFGVQVAKDFDLVAGTSTGGILTCAYLLPDKPGSKKPKFNTKEVVGLYFERGDEIFDVPIFHKIRTLGGILDEKYPEDGIEEALHDYFGDAWLKDLMKPCIVTSYDIRRRKGHFFGQHKAQKSSKFNFKVKDVARATAAAPTYFECAKVASEYGDEFPLIDGGVFVNNPALVAYAEGRSIFKVGSKEATAKDMKILSLGTGYTRKKYHYSKAKNYGMAEWVQPVIDIMMSGASEVAHYQLDKIYGTIQNPDQYLRIDGDLKTTDIDPDMDCATKENMARLKAFGQQLFEENKEKIEGWLGI
ncbi:Patatin-like phospholipase/acyl hydrolase [Ekhidna lutea]|uniref:Patatin-like phospholipase/acyl hydrolase n=1 Tax=Ekhidna lutea TaxID=447679 RepID=A0A239IH29_EKHLU|nr:patatin-like phospholipase family protein [Ekhidna lutea]SNS93036.1 Patatin-like phospholipase/acyl hydrolase [Ekhidna lutea]